MVAREGRMSRLGPAGLRRGENERPKALIALKQRMKEVWCPEISPQISRGEKTPCEVWRGV